MTPELFNPIEGPRGGWPGAVAAERACLEGFAAKGSSAFIANLRTRVLGLRYGELILPVTVNEAEYGDAYVCLPHSAYCLYAKAELDIEDVGPWKPLLYALADGAGLAMRAARLNRVVHLDNWMLSTNLHGEWDGEGLAEIREFLMDRFPDHLFAVRSVNQWSDAPLARNLRRDGWRLLPSRQIYVIGDPRQDWARRRDVRNDRKLLAESGLVVDQLDRLAPGDADRIAELYRLLYIERYSALNPAFTPSYIELTHASGMLRYRGLRDPGGALVAVVGCLVRGGVLTTPIVGYDTAQPPANGLYRLACVLLTEMAMELDARLNASAGASAFKRSRGAQPVLEYAAYYADHLSWPRRAVLAAMDVGLNRLAAPFVVERAL